MALLIALSITGSATALSAEPGDMSALRDTPNVTTLAGDGAAGINDGPAKTAKFLAPVGLTYDRHGDLIIADRDAQRIRVLSKNGIVRTLAGSGRMTSLGIGVPGGFKDGSAQQARFNNPLSIAVLANDDILIADSKNHVIRRLHDGTVSTFAGAHEEAGNTDGPVASARFADPRSIVALPDDTVYVADYPNGVRRIKNGVVSTLHFKFASAVTALSLTQSTTPKLLAGTSRQIFTVDLNSTHVDYEYETESLFVNVPSREGFAPAGPPSAIAALGDDSFVYTDALHHAVRMGQNGEEFFAKVLSALPSEDSSNRGGAYSDGSGSTAQFFAPQGIAADGRGGFAVSDTGNRRIRFLSPFNYRTDVLTSVHHDEANVDPNAYNVAIVGNSYVWTNQSWESSIAGETTAKIRAADRAHRVRVYPIERQGIPALAAMDLINNLYADGPFNMIVLDIPTYGQLMTAGEVSRDFGPGWQLTLQQAIQKTSKNLAAHNVKFMVLVQPGALDFPNELAYRTAPKGLLDEHSPVSLIRDPAEIEQHHGDMAKALQAASVSLLDVWPEFLASENARLRKPLFGTWDHHLSPAGVSLVSDALAKRLLHDKPWAK